MELKDTPEQRDSLPFFFTVSKKPTHNTRKCCEESDPTHCMEALGSSHLFCDHDVHLQHFKGAGLEENQWLSLLEFGKPKRFRGIDMGGYALLWNSRACFLNHSEDVVWATMVHHASWAYPPVHGWD